MFSPVSDIVKSFPVEPVKLIDFIVAIEIKGSCASTPSCLFLSRRHKFATLVQEVIVARQIGPSSQSEDQLLVFLVLLLSQVVLDQQIAELLLKQVVSLNFATEVLSQLLVGENEFAHGVLLLVHVGFLHLGAMELLLQNVDPSSELLCLLGAVCVANQRFELLVLTLKLFQVDLLLFNHFLKFVVD